jgi:hypothetical protein
LKKNKYDKKNNISKSTKTIENAYTQQQKKENAPSSHTRKGNKENYKTLYKYKHKNCKQKVPYKTY